jgi:hypothetical protein
MVVLWVAAPCSGDHRPDNGGSKHLWNVGKLLPDYTAQQTRRQPSSYSPPWEPQISLNITNIKFIFFFTSTFISFVSSSSDFPSHYSSSYFLLLQFVVILVIEINAKNRRCRQTPAVLSRRAMKTLGGGGEDAQILYLSTYFNCRGYIVNWNGKISVMIRIWKEAVAAYFNVLTQLER